MIGHIKNRLKIFSVSRNLGEIKHCENNIIMFGLVGHGKTTLLNKACGTSFKTAESGFSCTTDIQYAYSIRGDMAIIDFPGVNSTTDTIKHLKIQKSTLKVIPVRMICFVIKYDKRYDYLITNLSKIISIFYNYKDNITIIVTHSEDCKYTDKENIKALFKQYFSITNVLFTTKNGTSYVELCDTLQNLKSEMKNHKKLNLHTRDFLATVEDVFDITVMDERNKYEEEFNDTLKKFKVEFKNAIDDDLKRALFFAFRNYKEDLLRRYSEIVSEKKVDNDSIITEVIMFNNIIFNKFNEFRKEVQSQIKLQTNNYNNEYNRYKKCPHCGTIWFKIKGCDSMVCGTRTKLEDKICGRYKNYIVEYINKKIKIDYKENQNFNPTGTDSEIVGLTDEEKRKNFILEMEGKVKISPVGCGKSFQWNDKLVEDCTDEIVRKLNEISITDYDSGVRDIADNLGEQEL